MTREDVFRYAKERYGTDPEYLWEKYPDNAVLRNSRNRKWYAAVLPVRRSAIGLEGDSRIDVLNVKCSPLVREILIGEGKAVPAYHMNKRLWISVILDNVTRQELWGVLDESYELVK